MNRKQIYLLITVIGLVAPYYFFISFLAAHGLNAGVFLQQLFGTPISAFFAVDLILSCVVFVSFLIQEATRYSIKHRWIYILALLTVGLSFALPLFLYVRESRIDAGARSAGVAL